MPSAAVYSAMGVYKIIARKTTEQEYNYYTPLREHLDLSGEGREKKPVKEAEKITQGSKR